MLPSDGSPGGRSPLGSAGIHGAASGAEEVSRLQARVAHLEGEQERRIKLEKLLEVQTVQVDLQKELRVKTESLLQVEQQTSSKLRQQVDEMRRAPASSGEQSPSQARRQIEYRFAQAQEHIHALEQQLANASPESTNADIALQKQLAEQEALIKQLREQMEAKAPAGAPAGDAVRLQLLLQSRDKHLDELTQSVRKAQNEAAEAQSEAEVLRNQVRVLKKEVSQRAEEMERQLHTERSVRAEGFQLKAKLDQLAEQNREETRRAAGFADTAREVEDARRRIETLEQQLAEEKAASGREREQLAAEVQSRLGAKDKAMRHQTSTIEALNRELKEKQAEIERLVRACGGEAAEPSAPREPAAARVLPPLGAPSPRGDEAQGAARSTESLQRQIKAKDAKIAKQSEKVQILTEMVEKRDKQIEELSTAKRDRVGMESRVAELEDVLRAQPKVGSRTEAERRLIEQELRARGQEGQERELQAALQRARQEKDALRRELEALRGSLEDGASSSGALQSENARLAFELSEARRQLERRGEELRRLQDGGPAHAMPDPAAAATLPAMQRRLQRLEQVDKALGRDVVLHLQEREGKIDTLSSQLDLLRSANADLQARLSAAEEGRAPAVTAGGGGPEALAAPAAQPVLQAAPQAMQAAGAPQPQQVLAQAVRQQVRQAPGGSPLGQDAERTVATTGSLQPPFPPPTRMPVVQDSQLTFEDLRNMSTEDIRNELISRRHECNTLEEQLEEKRQLVLKLIEEANLCNAEVASLQQTVQHAQKKANKQDREYHALLEDRDSWEAAAKQFQKTLKEKEEKVTKLFQEHQQDTSGNAAMDQVDQQGWKLKVIAPRQHEIRHSVFLVLQRRQSDTLDKVTLGQGLAHHFAISAGRIDIVEDAARGAEGAADGDLSRATSSSGGHSDLNSQGAPHSRNARMSGFLDSQEASQSQTFRRDLVLVNIADVETNDAGEVSRSTISALDVLNQVRNDMLRGHRVGPIDGIIVDAVFINHGDMVLPFEWPSAQSTLLMREGRVLAGKHSVITVHEVRDPYILRLVAFDSEIGREFILYLNSRDVMLLLDTRDSEAVASVSEEELELSTHGARAPAGEDFQHLLGPCVQQFRQCSTVSSGDLLDGIVSSLSFSVFNGQQILVASEMRIPLALQPQRAESTQLALLDPGAPPPQLRAHQSAALAEAGVTRGLRPQQRQARRLYEDVVGFEGRLCIFSLIHTTTEDLSEDVLRASLYYPKTTATIQATLADPMLSDRLRIVSEAGELDVSDAFHAVVVVEEVVYPPAFIVRLTSVSLEDEHSVSPQEASKPHTHIIRVSKDGANAVCVPDMSFAVGPSTMRSKLLWCIGLTTPVQGPRETLVKLPGMDTVTAGASKNVVVRRTITGHPNEHFGLTVHLLGAGGRAESERAAQSMPAPMKAQLRAKYGKGRLLARHGRMLALRGSKSEESIRAVVSVYERSQPYHHFVMSAYEPQTSREWEVLADSIDIFRLFSDREEKRAQDLANPVTRERLAQTLVRSLELCERESELVLVVSPAAVREHKEKEKVEHKQQALMDREKNPEVSGRESREDYASPLPLAAGRASPLQAFDARPAITSTIARAVGGFTGDYDRGEDVMVEESSRDRLFTAVRRLALRDNGAAEPFKIQIYDNPKAATLHSYVVVASPAHDQPLAASGLPIALTAEQLAPPPDRKARKAYTLKVDDRTLESFLWDTTIMEPSRQEELLTFISESLHLDEDATGQMRLCMRKKKLRAHQVKEAKARAGETGALAPASDVPGAPDGFASKSLGEVGGTFPLNRLRLNRAPEGNKSTDPSGPSLQGSDDSEVSRIFVRGWAKIYCVAQRLGSSTVIITVSKRGHTYKLGVYEPESSALYEMCLVTNNSSNPLNVLIERCELSTRLDLMLLMQEQAFPHQVVVNLVHIGTSQEFHLKIGDEQVYTMIENSRREAFLHFFDQIITWGCIGFHAASPLEEQANAVSFEETFAGNQMFEKAELDDLLNQEGTIGGPGGERRHQSALPPARDKKLRVPVIRTHLDFLGKKDLTTGITMHLLYHAERKFSKDNQTLLVRVHKRVTTNDVALTLRVRSEEALALPELPSHVRSAICPTPSTANGRPFETPALGSGEASDSSSEVTIWLQDKCSRAPCGAFGEICEVPGFSKQVIILATDEDTPRVMRIAIALAQPPFTVLFQVVLLESSEPSAKVEPATTLKHNAGRKVLHSMFQHYMGVKQGQQQAVVSHLTGAASSARSADLRQKLDDISPPEGPIKAMGVEQGSGAGGPQRTSGRSQDEPVDVGVVHMATRRKLGRMMVFTVYRNMYLRVVMHDPTTSRDFHLSLLHYTTQRLLNTLRINRDMLEDQKNFDSEADKVERQQLRCELGKLIVDHLYLVRVNGGEGAAQEEVIDDLDPGDDDDDEIEYELRMRDMMDSSLSADLTVKQKLLNVTREQRSPSGQAVARLDDAPEVSGPRTILDMKESSLIYKAEKIIGGRRVLIAFYNETRQEDVLNYSHNFRIVVASVQSLEILAFQDFHEDTLEFVCSRRGKSHLMSAAREQELVLELWECLALQHVGQKITGITFAGMD
ncbi:unnamed protein product [Prorocentrum cordatum]|uniref:Uncharacterized protein n=1 Tax=Prorocentrum cordatum TaxID=2364126 RepID=A0ABN9QHQ2_9DINO|nr:unnamed protein product [Polarella glacialis]